MTIANDTWKIGDERSKSSDHPFHLREILLSTDEIEITQFYAVFAIKPTYELYLTRT